MGVMAYDSVNQVWVDAKPPEIYDSVNQVWVPSHGAVYDAGEQAWVEAWGEEKRVYLVKDGVSQIGQYQSRKENSGGYNEASNTFAYSNGEVIYTVGTSSRYLSYALFCGNMFDFSPYKKLVAELGVITYGSAYMGANMFISSSNTNWVYANTIRSLVSASSGAADASNQTLEFDISGVDGTYYFAPAAIHSAREATNYGGTMRVKKVYVVWQKDRKEH